MTNGNDPIQMDVTEYGTMGGMHGLTKREYFAAMAMQGILANHQLIDTDSWEWAAKASVNAADFLIKALNENK